MPINRVMAAALHAVSYADINMKKRYKMSRTVNDIVHYPRKHNISDCTAAADDGYDIPLRVFFPQKQRSNEVIMFFHGGGWVIGNVESYTNTCAVMADKTGRRVVSVDYRLAPEYKFPRAPEDCFAAASALYSGKLDEVMGGAADGVVLAGDSAGGNLAAVVSIMASERKAFDVKKQILFYPATYHDHSQSSPFPSIKENGTGYLLTSKRVCDYMDLYLPDKDKRLDPHFAPFLEKEPYGRPRTLIITAEYDPLRDEGETYGAKLKKFGNDVTVYRMRNALHGFLSLPPRFVHIVKAYEIVNKFLNGGDLR